MASQEQENKKDKVGEEEKPKQEDPPTKPYSSTTSSPSSSPSREFSFTISLHPSSAGSNISNSFAIDLSPADDIFFHGHLLPLHLISHIPLSRSSSKNSLDTFSLVIKDISEDHQHHDENRQNNTSTNNGGTTKGRIKMKPLSSFWFAKWRKGSEKKEENKKNNKKAKFELLQLFKRYLRMVKPNRQIRRRTFSFSFTDIIRSKEKQQLQGRRGGGGVSAPATMQTSPRNSGNVTPDSLFPSASDGSMEELHTAIQAAIAHCKNSTSVK